MVLFLLRKESFLINYYLFDLAFNKKIIVKIKIFILIIKFIVKATRLIILRKTKNFKHD